MKQNTPVEPQEFVSIGEIAARLAEEIRRSRTPPK